MIGGGYFQFLEISVFFIHRKLRPMNEKALRAGCAPCGDEVCCKQHRSGTKESQATLCPTWNHNVWRNRVAPRENAPDWKKFRSGAFFNNKIRAECELYCFDNMVLQQVIREWRLG